MNPHAWLSSFNIEDYIQWLYSEFIACILTQINWVNMYGTQIALHYV